MAKYGDAVRVEESSLTPTTTADFLDGGDPFANNTRGLLCSVGFNVSRAGVNYFLTAGHCGQPGDVTSQNGVFIGPFEQSVFPTSDEALVRNDNTGFWIQGPWVFAYTGDPNAVFNLSGFRDSPVGTPICKSGITTQVTCGSVTVKDESVNAFDQNGNFLGTIFGLTRHTACAEPGDSGGSNFSFDNTGNFAEGTTSLSSLDGAGHCGEHQNPPVQSTAWFFPVADEISSFGVTLMTL
jgi:streptogrisin C